MKIAVFGATGRTGIPLVELGLERGHEIVAFARDATDLPTELRDHERLSVVVGDAYAGDGVDAAVGGVDGSDAVDAVVSVLGQTGDGPDELLTVAGRRVLDAMEEYGVDRYVTLVGAGVREEGESVSLGGKVMGSMLKLLAREVLADADAHVDEVRASDLRWTVVRVPRLTDGELTAEYDHGTDLKLGMRDVATRTNVAQFVLDCLESDDYVREMPKVTDR